AQGLERLGGAIGSPARLFHFGEKNSRQLPNLGVGAAPQQAAVRLGEQIQVVDVAEQLVQANQRRGALQLRPLRHRVLRQRARPSGDRVLVRRGEQRKQQQRHRR